MKTRTDLLNFLAEKYNLQRYLEIGVQVPELNFDKIKSCCKVGVDPSPNIYSEENVIYQLTSDEFFTKFQNGWPGIETWPNNSVGKFDLIFIDGLHTAEQVKIDFENALKILSPNGFIVLHDCNPEKEEHTIVPRPTERGHWNGDVWKFAAALYGYSDIDRHTIDIDNGCMIFRNNDDYTRVSFGISQMPWAEFDRNRKKYLNLITWDEFISLNPHV
jgi:hypothetical protein